MSAVQLPSIECLRTFVAVDSTRYVSAGDSVFDAIAASDTLLTFVGEKSRIALPSAPVLARLLAAPAGPGGPRVLTPRR